MTYGLYNYFDHPSPGKKAPVIQDDELLFIVREPFLSKTSKIGITGFIATISSSKEKAILVQKDF